jgi:hypothetical protein
MVHDFYTATFTLHANLQSIACTCARLHPRGACLRATTEASVPNQLLGNNNRAILKGSQGSDTYTIGYASQNGLLQAYVVRYRAMPRCGFQ